MKRIVILLTLLVFFGSCKSTSNIVTSKKETTKNRRINTKNDNQSFSRNDNSSYLAKQLINSASKNLGVRYRAGGTTSEGFDCSGLIYSTFKKFGYILPRTSKEMGKTGVQLNPYEIQKGDLIFFGTNDRDIINHVGLVTQVSNDEIKFIHSSSSRGVIISSTKETYYQNSFIQANRIME